MVRLQLGSFFGMRDRKPGLSPDDLRHQAAVARVDVLDDDDDRSEPTRQLAEKLGQGADAARRGGDRDYVKGGFGSNRAVQPGPASRLCICACLPHENRIEFAPAIMLSIRSRGATWALCVEPAFLLKIGLSAAEGEYPGAEDRRRPVRAVCVKRRRLRDLHARSDGQDRDLERRRPADQGLHRGRGHRPPLLALLPARRGPQPETRLGARGGQARGALHGRGLAAAQGRHALLGEHRHHGAEGPDRPVARLRQGHARPDRAPRAGGSAQRGP